MRFQFFCTFEGLSYINVKWSVCLSIQLFCGRSIFKMNPRESLYLDRFFTYRYIYICYRVDAYIFHYLRDYYELVFAGNIECSKSCKSLGFISFNFFVYFFFLCDLYDNFLEKFTNLYYIKIFMTTEQIDWIGHCTYKYYTIKFFLFQGTQEHGQLIGKHLFLKEVN